MFRKKTLDPAPTFWIAATALPATPATTFFARLGAALNGVGFGDAVRAASAPYYEMDGSKGGAPGIDPEAAGVRAVIAGHSHRPLIERRDAIFRIAAA